jgi:hypothetical protein
MFKPSLIALAKNTTATSKMQAYYLACLEEFGPDLVDFVEQLCMEAYEDGYLVGLETNTE